jgi:hypothetical protein
MLAAATKGLVTVKVNRSEFRQRQSDFLGKAKGQTVVEVTAWDAEDDKYVVDKRYFDDLLVRFRALRETLSIMANPKLYNQLLRAGKTIDEDVRLGRLHSFEEAFGEE